ncbi:DNA mismatch repair protein MutS [Salibacterium qingdaonense]|uniref:DNA mismatch repair protein MutS n=1 Tax=Salibacterium qingdaonense TaxID=266892 RepID=A0A1I4K8Q5_9BACI|nr:DNA mismatch repair protein MutS [Salibacterium qingdaonense]SFL74953.1 DNA mismatch repair protein MutS [Salibacterium qingdaonense]
MAEETPMMKQYKDIKSQYGDTFLFYRLGDFYELFFDDAVQAARELEITLTRRGSSNEQHIPMCGVPYHSAEQYISTLIEKGYKIAICEQVEDPKTAKGVVRREVVQVVTPGTVMEGRAVRENENNFTAALYPCEDGTASFVKADLTTGEIEGAVLDKDTRQWQREITRTGIKELIVPSFFDAGNILPASIVCSTEENTELQQEFQTLLPGNTGLKVETAFALLTNYFMRTQKRSLSHLQTMLLYRPKDSMQLDIHARRNLELTETLMDHNKKGSLLWLMDQTVTAMGGRLVRKWVEQPLLNAGDMKKRHSVVESFLAHYFEREELRDRLRYVYDLERLAGKTAYGNVNAREMVQLRRSLQELPDLFSLLDSLENETMKEWTERAGDFSSLRSMLEKSLEEDPPVSITDGGLIKEGWHDKLDEYKEASRNGKDWISRLEKEERDATGIKSLKVGFNKVFGYYIEVTRPNIPYLPEGRYERKQTLTNAERYITPELKEKEEMILGAEQHSTELEYQLFLEIRDRVKEYLQPLQQTARIISEMDVLQGFAVQSERMQYVRPEFSSSRRLSITDGRHPVIEQMLDQGEYVANDMELNDQREILLITGPNMAGKSTYMRQTALISIMAQAGCFVPAEKAELPVFDQIFTRIGASDDLTSGQSTFMVEMLETKQALSMATPDSLILLDEIGRGTSTYDGMALAQSIVEYIHERVGAKTLFSTHYHELTTLEDTMSKLFNVHVRAVEEEGNIVFLHKVEQGRADRSYGIYVAKLAELPEGVLDRAETLLHQFEGNDAAILKERIEEAPVQTDDPSSDTDPGDGEQLALFEPESPSGTKQKHTSRTHPVVEDLKKADVLHMSPIQALELLYEYQQKLKE